MTLPRDSSAPDFAMTLMASVYRKAMFQLASGRRIRLARGERRRSPVLRRAGADRRRAADARAAAAGGSAPSPEAHRARPALAHRTLDGADGAGVARPRACRDDRRRDDARRLGGGGLARRTDPVRADPDAHDEPREFRAAIPRSKGWSRASHDRAATRRA